MKLLSFLHRWAGGVIGLLLAVLGLSGTILVWEGEWISLPGAGDPVIELSVSTRSMTRSCAPGSEIQASSHSRMVPVRPRMASSKPMKPPDQR